MVSRISHLLWLIPLLPLLAAGFSALLKQRQRKLAAGMAIGLMTVALVLSCLAFRFALRPGRGPIVRAVPWFQMGNGTVELSWVLDPLTSVMLVMVSFVALLIFIYSVGYMERDANFTRFFCFLSLFAAAMLGLVISNSLLLFFICWELVGLASYLLIGFWYTRPAAAAAARKAFLTTRIGDVGFFLGMIWLYKETGTLLLYDGGHGCLEQKTLTSLAGQALGGGVAVSTAISLLIFCGAIGKSGQVPLHVWLPDAMEGPTPVSALIHAATMVAAGVFLVARVYPLMQAVPGDFQPPGMIRAAASVGVVAPAAGISPQNPASRTVSGESHGQGRSGVSTALKTVTWVGAITALFAALVAVAQTDIKRILAYSTVSQLGYMMMGLGVGGVAVGMFHLITHAFFKALLFLGAGSVLHGCSEEQDIRRMGGLRQLMPVTFATYAVGMMALSGVPLLFSGFWSKDEILHAAWHWPGSHGPFLLGLAAALLTAFYMTRQMGYVFFGRTRGAGSAEQHPAPANTAAARQDSAASHEPHESPPVMTVPLVILAVFAVLLGFLGTPFWPWFQRFLGGEAAASGWPGLAEALPVMLLSTLVVGLGITLGWRLYGGDRVVNADQPDALEARYPRLFRYLQGKFFVDELYGATLVAWNDAWARVCDFMDRWVWGGLVRLVSLLAESFAALGDLIDAWVVNGGFDAGCRRLRGGGGLLSAWQDRRVRSHLRVIGLGLVVLVLVLLWGCR